MNFFYRISITLAIRKLIYITNKYDNNKKHSVLVFIYNDIIDPEFSKFALAEVYDDLDKMQQNYIATTN